jgi:hypothetical protein
LSRGCSLEKPKTSVSRDDFDPALLFDKPARVRVSEHCVVPDPTYAIGMHLGSDSGLEEAPPHSLTLNALAILLYEPDLTHAQ